MIRKSSSRRRQQSNRLPRTATSAITNSGSTASSVFRALNSLTAPRLNQFFPDTYYTWSKTVIETQLTGGNFSNTFRVNSPATGFGPQVNWTGAFANNNPAGLSYLLGSDQITGSSAPYQYLAVLELEHLIDVINSSAIPAIVSLVPAQSPSLSGLSSTQLAEQRGAVQVLIPPTMTSVPTRLRLAYKLESALGVSYNEVSNNIGYKVFPTGTPVIQYYNHLVASPSDGSTAINVWFRHTFYLRCKFSDLNTFTTTTPT